MTGVLKYGEFSVDNKGEVIAEIAVIKNSHKTNHREICI